MFVPPVEVVARIRLTGTRVKKVKERQRQRENYSLIIEKERDGYMVRIRLDTRPY